MCHSALAKGKLHGCIYDDFCPTDYHAVSHTIEAFWLMNGVFLSEWIRTFRRSMQFKEKALLL